MFSKGYKIYSILNSKCPQCHIDYMYETKNPYHISKVNKMNEKCSNCGLKYEIEPSFFYGALYVNYGLTVAVSIATFVVAKFFLNLTILQSFIAIVCAILIGFPIYIRLSRNIWINFFVNYKKNLKE